MKYRFRCLVSVILSFFMVFGSIGMPGVWGHSAAIPVYADSPVEQVVKVFDQIEIEVGETVDVTDPDITWELWTKTDSYELLQNSYEFAEIDDWEWENFGCLEVTGVKEGSFTYTIYAYRVNDWVTDRVYDATYIYPVKVVAAGSKQVNTAITDVRTEQDVTSDTTGRPETDFPTDDYCDFVPESRDEKASIKACTIKLSKTSFAYTGKAIKPGVTVRDGSKTLKKGTDYTVSFSKNKKVGTATVSIKGKGTYEGTVNKKFDIVPKLSISIAELETGETVNIKAKSSGTITYKSSDKSVATVSKKGVITGVSEGSANITVTSNGKSSVCEVIVYEPYIYYDKDEVEPSWDDDTIYGWGPYPGNTSDSDSEGNTGNTFYDPCEDGSCGHPECQPGNNNNNNNNDNNLPEVLIAPANTETAADGAYILPSLTAINNGLQLTKEDMLKNFNISYYTYPMNKPEMDVDALIESIKAEMKKYGFEYATTYAVSSSYIKFFFTYVGDKQISPAGCTNNNDGKMYDMNVEYFKFSNQADGLQFSYPKEFVAKDAVEYRAERQAAADNGVGGNNGNGANIGNGVTGGDLGVDCPRCIDGWALCWKCSNVTPTHRPCDTCHAHGYEYVGLKQITCRKCNNLKYLPCSACDGKGRVICGVCYGRGTW